MTESRIEKLTRIGEEMAAAVAEMRADAADVTSQDPETAALVEELSVTCDRWSQWEEVVAVALTHLRSAGRLIPAGGMALTAEQVKDMRRLLDAFASERDECDTWDLYDRLRALFPATEPTEHVHEQGAHYTKGHTNAGTWTVSTCRTCGAVIERVTEGGPWIDRADPPAPAEPAEEETKAEAVEAAITNWVETAYQTTFAGLGHSDAELAAKKAIGEMRHLHLTEPWLLAKRITDILSGDTDPASSPVVPAPTETGPWQTWDAVPEGVKYYGINAWGPTYYVNRGGVRHRVFDDTPSKTADYIVQGSAPFVAAEEG